MGLALNVLGNREDAEDACQDAFASAFFNLEARSVPDNLKAWIFTIVYRRCLDILRRRRRSLRLFLKVRAGMRPTSSVAVLSEACAHEKIASSVVSSTVLKLLTEKERLALTLWTSEDSSYREIAAVLGCSEGTARVHLFRARRKIKALMEKDDDPLPNR